MSERLQIDPREKDKEQRPPKEKKDDDTLDGQYIDRGYPDDRGRQKQEEEEYEYGYGYGY